MYTHVTQLPRRNERTRSRASIIASVLSAGLSREGAFSYDLPIGCAPSCTCVKQFTYGDVSFHSSRYGERTHREISACLIPQVAAATRV